MIRHRRTFTATSAMVAATALVLAACGSGDDGNSGSGDGDGVDLDGKDVGAMDDYDVGVQFTATEPLNFSTLYNEHPNYPLKDDWLFWEELEERTNVTLDTTVVPLSDYEDKRSLLIGSGDAPLIMPKTYPGQEEPFVSSGAILPVSDYVDLMPNFQAKVEQWGLEDNLDTLRQEDGKYYVLPGLHEAPWQDYTVAMRMDVLEDLGLEVPTDWDEFRDVLAAIKEEYPDSYPFSGRWNVPTPGGSMLNIVGMTFGTSAGWGFNHEQWDEDAGQFVYTGATEEYRAMLEYLHGLMEDGLMDPEGFTQDDDLARQKFSNGRSFAIGTNAQTLVNEYRPDLAETNPDAVVAKIPLPAGPAGNVINSTSQLENGIMLSSKAAESENFVAMMQFIDWLWYSDEGQEFAKWGVEGVTYTKDGDGTYTLADDVDFVALNPDGDKHLQEDFGFSNGVFAYGGSTELLHSTFSEEEQEFQEAMAEKDLLPLDPPHPFTEEEREQVTLWETPLKDHTEQATLQFILGQRDLSEWDAYVAELEAKGMSQYVDVVNEAYERYQAEHG
ncbi:ABC transporter substrate-binding protein [Phytoactinopolyspora halotolerans]|uniref:Extracellular solute-binding protein n=1 Tax=Phytoactinopolyspora halotolerans TaxID=1981512 RepID=A0A6L9S3A6_9ACTN|nr:extracellular solute-binding protein [Phytoactinopolyspora halotolerans]NED99536.1 extracellular solute-binding protein [Phytoactinopolyspora halotolerans]